MHTLHFSDKTSVCKENKKEIDLELSGKLNLGYISFTSDIIYQ